MISPRPMMLMRDDTASNKVPIKAITCRRIMLGTPAIAWSSRRLSPSIILRRRNGSHAYRLGRLSVTVGVGIELAASGDRTASLIWWRRLQFGACSTGGRPEKYSSSSSFLLAYFTHREAFFDIVIRLLRHHRHGACWRRHCSFNECASFH